MDKVSFNDDLRTMFDERFDLSSIDTTRSQTYIKDSYNINNSFNVSVSINVFNKTVVYSSDKVRKTWDIGFLPLFIITIVGIWMMFKIMYTPSIIKFIYHLPLFEPIMKYII